MSILQRHTITWILSFYELYEIIRWIIWNSHKILLGIKTRFDRIWTSSFIWLNISIDFHLIAFTWILRFSCMMKYFNAPFSIRLYFTIINYYRYKFVIYNFNHCVDVNVNWRILIHEIMTIIKGRKLKFNKLYLIQ